MEKSASSPLKNEVYKLISTDKSIYEAIEEHAHQGFWYLDLDNKTNWWANPRFWHSLGFSSSSQKAEAPGPSLEEILLSDDLTSLLQTIENLSKEDSFLLTLKYLHKNNQVLSFEVNAKVIRDNDGKATTLLALHNKSKDIPFFVNDLYSQVLYSVHESYQLTDTKGNILDANDSFCKLFGYTRHELLTMSLGHLSTELTPDKVQDFINKVLAKNGGTISTKARTKDGCLIDIEIRTTLIDHNGKPLLASFVRDVTEQLKTNEKLEIALQRYNSHRNNSPLGTVEYTKDLIVTQWSRQCEEIFEWTAEEILSANISAFNLIYEADIEATTKVAIDLMSGKVDGNVSVNRNYTKSGRIVTCVWYNSVIKNEKGEVIAVISLVQDVTHEKEIELGLKASEEKLREAQKIAKIGDSTLNLVTGEFSASEGMLDMVRLNNKEGIELKEWLKSAQHPEDAHKFEQYIRDCIAKNDDTIPPIEYRLTRSDGVVIWVRTQGKIIYKDEKPTTVFFTTQDISHSKAVEEQIKASEMRFRSLIENSKDGLVIISVEGNIDYISPSIE
ncbi:MAG: PAS domain S-box protein, partial [Imperialibacter sp.]